jgi:ABC-2 type transport system ATP-binding protein
MDEIIKITNLSKTFRTKERYGFLRKKQKIVEALKNINLTIYRGEIFGLLGPNGAGKTTLIKCLTTLLLPDSGTAWINGYNIHKDENMVRASIGCMLMGERGLYWKLTGRENLEYFGALYHIPKYVYKKRIEELINLLNLHEYINRTVETYSSGQKMKLAFAKALLNSAPVLFFDEPTITMDVHAAKELRKIVRDLNEDGHTIVYTTHLMHEAEELCHRVAIIDRGEIIALGTVEELKASMKKEHVLKIEGILPDTAIKLVSKHKSIKKYAVEVEKSGKTVLNVVCDDSRVLLPWLINQMANHNAKIEYISPREPSLEDVFIAKTGRTLSVDTRV